MRIRQFQNPLLYRIEGLLHGRCGKWGCIAAATIPPPRALNSAACNIHTQNTWLQVRNARGQAEDIGNAELDM